MKPQSLPALTQMERSLVMGTAGHIDHGKTALVLALTGKDPDRLPEEKARGITIDLGFAALRLAGDAGRWIDLSLVDVPGHQAFIHNMLAGAGGIEAVLLVVAANEGVQAQTVEHLAICSLLGIEYGVIALTKADAVSAKRLEETREQVLHLVHDTFLRNAPVVAVSAFTGFGIDELKRQLLRIADALPARGDRRIARLPLDRAFSMPGFGTIVTGTLLTGALHVGDNVELQPAGRPVRVRGMQVHQRTRQSVRAPNRVALNLAAIEVSDIGRGDVIVPPDTLIPTTTTDVELRTLVSVASLRHRGRVQVHAFTSEASATVLFYDTEAKAKTRLARLRLHKPMLLVPGDHFVLRASNTLLGGGTVLDAHPLPRLRKGAALRWLQRVQGASPSEDIYARIQRQGTRGIRLRALLRETGFQEKHLLALVAPLTLESRVVTYAKAGNDAHAFLDIEALHRAADLIVKELAHASSGSSTRAVLLSRTRLDDWVFDLALGHLGQIRPLHTSSVEISLADTIPAPQSESRLLATVEDLYRSAGLAPPIVAEAAAALQVEVKNLTHLLTLLLRAGRLVRMGSDTLLMHVDALAKIKADLLQHRGETMDVGRFKSFTGLTRKHAIPLLQYLDAARVTRNRNGIREILQCSWRD